MQEMTPYELLGGAGVVRWLTDRFYDIMDTDPSVKSLRDMHPADLAGEVLSTLVERNDLDPALVDGWISELKGHASSINRFIRSIHHEFNRQA